MDIENKFIFTDEGRRLLISQDGGIRLAILGGILIQGLEPVDAADFFDTYRGLTLDDLRNDSIVLGLAGVHYTHTPGTQNVTPSDKSAYEDAITDKNITKHLFGTFYLPSREVVSNNGTSYGTYEFTYDKTSLACDFDVSSNDSASFPLVAIIGKQYAETDDAIFNVNETQKPIIVGVAQIAGKYDIGTDTFTGGIQFLGNQAEYIRTDLRIQFALTDDDRDVSEIAISGSEDYLDMVSKLSIVNDGLRTDSSVNLVPNSELSLSEEGSIATPKSLMLADPYRSDELENQWNAAARLHIINKKSEAGDAPTYREQVVLTTIDVPDDLNSAELTAHHMGMMLCGTEGENSPVYMQGENPTYAVDLFGLENSAIGEGNGDKFLFATGNLSIVSGESSGSNIVIGSSGNNILSDKNNLLLNSNNNILSGTNDKFTVGNVLLASDNNTLRNRVNPGVTTTYEDTSGNILIGTSGNNIAANRNIIIGGEDNNFRGLSDCVFIGAAGVMTDANKQHCIILGNYPDIRGNRNTPNNSLIYGNGTSDSDRSNALVFSPASATMSMSGHITDGNGEDEKITATYYSGGFRSIGISSNSSQEIRNSFAELTPYGLSVYSGVPNDTGSSSTVVVGNDTIAFVKPNVSASIGIVEESNTSYLTVNEKFKTNEVKSNNISATNCQSHSISAVNVSANNVTVNNNFSATLCKSLIISASSINAGTSISAENCISPNISATNIVADGSLAMTGGSADFTCPTTFNGPVSSYDSLTVSSTQDTSACGLSTPRMMSIPNYNDTYDLTNLPTGHKGERIIICSMYNNTSQQATPFQIKYRYYSGNSNTATVSLTKPTAVEFIRIREGTNYVLPIGK